MVDGAIKPITGYLSKWTNYVRGYQSRYFVISNGFLSYYRSSICWVICLVLPCSLGLSGVSVAEVHGKYCIRFLLVSVYFIFRNSNEVDEGVCRGTMCLSSATVNLNNARSFCVSNGQMSYHLKANTSEDREQWVKAIRTEADKYYQVNSQGNIFLCSGYLAYFSRFPSLEYRCVSLKFKILSECCICC